MEKLNFKTCNNKDICHAIELIELEQNISKSGYTSNEQIIYLKELKTERAQRKAIANSQVGGIGIIKQNFIKLDLNSCSYKEIEDERNELIHADDHGVKLVDEELQYLKELTAEFVRRGGILEKHSDLNKIIKTQMFTLRIDHLANGSYNMSRQNDGFNIHELMGYISFIQLEICKQLSGEIKPDVIKREVIID